MEDEVFRADYQQLGPGCEVARLRIMRGLTQQELTETVGTHQSSVSRLESGECKPSLSSLRRVVEALNARLEVHAPAREEAVTVEERVAAREAAD